MIGFSSSMAAGQSLAWVHAFDVGLRIHRQPLERHRRYQKHRHTASQSKSPQTAPPEDHICPSNYTA